MHTIGPGGLKDYAENLEPFINQIPDYALYMLDLAGRVISWNAGAERLKGYAAQEIMGRHFSVFYPAEDVAADKPHRTLDHASRHGTYQEEGLRVRKDGAAFWAAVTITALRDTQGHLRGFAKLTRDITERKTHEAALQAAREARYRALFENSHDAIFLTRPKDGAVLAANPAACDLFGYSEQELLAMHRDELLDQTDPRFAGAWAKRTRVGAAAADLIYFNKGGARIEARVSSKLFTDENGQEVACTTIQDITEKKKAEAALRASEEQYRTLFDNMTEGFELGEPILDSAGNAVDFRYLAVNNAFYVQTGLPRGIEGRRVREFVPHVEQFWIDRYAAVARTGRPDRFEDYNTDTQRHYDVYTFRPSPGRFANLFRDITEQKRAEDELNTFKIFSDHSSESNLVMDAEGRIRYVNRKLCQRTGYSEEELLRLHIQDINPNATEALRGEVVARSKDGSVPPFESIRRRKDGSTYPVEVSATALEVQGEWLTFSVARDITERKRAEQALKDNERRLAMALEASGSAVYDTDLVAGIVRGEDRYFTMLGYAPGELTSLADWWDAVHPDDRDASAESFDDLIQGKRDYHRVEVRVRAKDGSWRWILSQATVAERDAEGRALRLIGTHTDITERKRAEQALQDSERRLAMALEASASAVWETDTATGIVRGDDLFFTRLGYAPGELATRNDWVALFYPDDQQTALETMEEVIRGQRDRYRLELRVRAKDGSWRWILSQVMAAERDAQGRAIRLVGTHTDITEHKQAEQRMQASEIRFHSTFEQLAVGLAHVSLEGVLLRVNAKFAAIVGSDRQTLEHMSFQELTHPDDLEKDLHNVAGLLAGSISGYTMEKRYIRKDRTVIWCNLTVSLVRTATGEPDYFVGVVEDIQARKEAEQALKESEERFRLLYENAPIGIIQVDQNGYVISANRKFAEITGYTVEEVIGLSHVFTTLPEDRAVVAELGEKMRAGEMDDFHQERRMLCKDGGTIWVRTTVEMIPDKPGRARKAIVLYEDITKKKKAEEALRQSEEKFRATFEHAPLGIAEAAIDGKIIEANAKAAEILGYTKDELTHLTVMDLTHPSELEESLANLQKLAKGAVDAYVMEKRYIRKDRSLVWVNVTVSLAPIPGKPQYMVVTVEDITARKKTEEDLKRAMEASYHQATHDMLTGLANRAALPDRLAEALAYAKRDGHLVALHLLDLDRFKSINDTLGHHIGDLLLKEVAKRIKSHVRATDLAARLGGDEFVVIQTHLADPAAAGVLAGKLVQELGRKYVLEQQDVQSGASIGIAAFPGDAENPEDLIKRADLALYEAKHRGRFNYQFYRQELGAAFAEAQRLEQELVRALRENEFCLHYLPQFDLKNGRMTGIEALLRWRHPTRGLLAAREFLPEAEHARLMLPIGEWALQTACLQHKEWIDAGLAVPLTLNLSSTQLRDPRLLDTLKRILEEAGLPASMLQLEMRESVLWDPKFSKRLLHQMKECGLRLALDDFGSEMTMLPSLDKLPLDAVKPGQRLVNRLPSHQPEAAMLAAIIDVAHHLNIAVCANGVETDDQFAAVTAQGCDSAQGYWLSSPLDANEMKQRIDAELMH